MTIINRRAFTLGAAAVGVSSFAIGRAHAAEFTYKFANNLALSHPLNIRAQEAANAIKEETKGRFELPDFPVQPARLRHRYARARSATARSTFSRCPASSSRRSFPPRRSAASASPSTATTAYGRRWTASSARIVRDEIAKSRQIIAFDKIWDNGFRQTTTSTKPIVKPADFDGMKLRVPAVPLWTSMFKAFGSAPTTINFNETYTALQSKVVDGQENPLAIIETAKLYEVQQYCSMTNHMWDGFWFLANRRNWEALPEDIRASITKNINAAGLAERADVAKLSGSLREQLTGKGMKFNDVNAALFREKLRAAGFYSEWKQKFGDQAWSTLEASVGKLS